MSFFHQTITLSDDEEEEEERISFESEVLAQVSKPLCFFMNFSINQVLACYNERLSTSKEEEEEDFGEDEKLKPTKKVSFEF